MSNKKQTPTNLDGSELPFQSENILPASISPRIYKRSMLAGVSIFVLNLSVYICLIFGIIFVENLFLKSILSMFAGMSIGLLFIVGHDACHHSLTPNKRINYLIGQIAFLPSLTPFSLWDLGHNRIHHRYTNLAPNDYVWTPLSKSEYDKLAPAKRWLYRLYRSGWGPILYYLFDIWYKKMIFPTKKEVGQFKNSYVRDLLIVYLYLLILLIGMHFVSINIVNTSGQSYIKWWELITFGFFLPFLVWNYIISFLIYMHHTHPKIPWFTNEEPWSKYKAKVMCTANTIFPVPINFLLHRIMEHTAHHGRAVIPMYHLKSAQDALISEYGNKIITYKWNLHTYSEILNKCKLFDYNNYRWTDFDGMPTSEKLL